MLRVVELKFCPYPDSGVTVGIAGTAISDPVTSFSEPSSKVNLTTLPNPGSVTFSTRVLAGKFGFCCLILATNRSFAVSVKLLFAISADVNTSF